MSLDYVPRKIAVFCAWFMNLFAYAMERYEAWGVPPPPVDLKEAVLALKELAERCATPDHTKIDTANKNDLWKVVEKETRVYLQGVIMHNKSVTMEDRRIMGLPVYDKVRTPIGHPVGQAEADITYPGRTQLILSMRHVKGTTPDARANAGYRIYYDVFAPGETLPTVGKVLRELRLTRHKKELFEFEQEDSGKTAVFCIRYENGKGLAGAWGPVFSAIIP